MIRRKWLLILMLVGFLIGMLPLPSQSVVPGINLLVFGQLELRRAGWTQYRSAQAFAELFSSDLVRLTQGSPARVLCANWQFKPVPPSNPISINQLCPPTEQPIIHRATGNLIVPKGGIDPLIPFLVNPRRTALLNPTPVIRWNRTPNAIRYRIALRDPSSVIWQQEVEGTEMAYTGTPALKAGVRYALVVQADTGASSQDEEVPGLAFYLLQPEQVKQIETAIAQLEQESQDAEERLIAEVYLYRSNNLLTDAIALLKSPVARQLRSPLIYRLLGDLYRQVQLNLYARNAYEQAVAFSAAPEYLEEKAQAQAALGEVLLMLRDRETAITAFRQARQAYATLEGEKSNRVHQLDEQLAELTP